MKKILLLFIAVSLVLSFAGKSQANSNIYNVGYLDFKITFPEEWNIIIQKTSVQDPGSSPAEYIKEMMYVNSATPCPTLKVLAERGFSATSTQPEPETVDSKSNWSANPMSNY